ncbi:MAG: hypothetical protein R8M45_06875 [Ghiorsea sp.]
MGTSAGITQGLMNGLNIYNSINDRKDRKEQYATGLQRQEAADERSTTLFDQGQGEFERKTKLRQDTSQFQKGVLAFSGSTPPTAETLTTLYKDGGIANQWMKPNQEFSRFQDHKNKDGTTSMVAFLNQTDESGNVVEVPFSHGRSSDANDPIVGFSSNDLMIGYSGYYADKGVNISAMNNIDAVKPMTDREKIAANQANKLINIGIEAKNAEDAAIAKFGRGGGSGNKPIIKTVDEGTKKKPNKKLVRVNKENNTYTEIRKTYTPTEALEKAKKEADKKAGFFSSDEADFGKSTHTGLKAKPSWIKRRTKELLGGKGQAVAGDFSSLWGVNK